MKLSSEEGRINNRKNVIQRLKSLKSKSQRKSSRKILGNNSPAK